MKTKKVALVKTEFGNVIIEPMMERSGNSAYAEIAKKMEQATNNSYEKGNASHPSVIAKVVSQAVKARKPKNRYAVGQLAKPLIFMRKWFGDRIFDKIILSAT